MLINLDLEPHDYETALAFIASLRRQLHILMDERKELRDALIALRDWCDSNMNAVSVGYAVVMKTADDAIAKAQQS